MWRPERAQQIMQTHQRLALVGAAKNVGKTTTLNALIAQADGVVGLVSIGIDGEPQDLLLGTPKPSIWAPEGALLISAQGALAQSTARVEHVRSLGFDTPLGEVILARVVDPGAVMLAGVRHRADLARGLQAMREAGAEHLLVDGAYGRAMAAHAQVCDAVILCTGAVLDPRVTQIVAHTQAILARLELPAPAPPLAALAQAALMRRRALLWCEQRGQLELPHASALLGLEDGRSLWSEHVLALAVPGLVSDRVVEALLALPGRAGAQARELILHDATALQASARHLTRLREAGWHISALGSVPVVALSYNPTSVAGYQVDGQLLGQQLQALDPARWVFDPRA